MIVNVNEIGIISIIVALGALTVVSINGAAKLLGTRVQ